MKTNRIARPLMKLSLISVGLSLGLSACAGEVASSNDNRSEEEQLEFADDSPIEAWDDQGAGDQGQDLFALLPELASGFVIKGDAVAWRQIGDFEYKFHVNIEAHRGIAAPSQNGAESFETQPSRASFRLERRPIGAPGEATSTTIFSSENVTFAYDGTVFTGEVDGHRIRVENNRWVKIEWSNPTADLQAIGELFAANVYDRRAFGVSQSAEVSGRLWNSMNAPIVKMKDSSVFIPIPTPNSFARQILEPTVGFGLQCTADRGPMWIGYVRKECTLSVTGSVIEVADAANSHQSLAYRLSVQRIIEGEPAARIFDQLDGDDSYRGFVHESGSLACKREAGATRCAVRVNAQP